MALFSKSCYDSKMDTLLDTRWARVAPQQPDAAEGGEAALVEHLREPGEERARVDALEALPRPVQLRPR